MSSSAKVMIHQPSLFTSKTSWTCNELEDTVKNILSSKENYINKMLENTTINQEEMITFMMKDTYLNSAECIELGIVDKVL